MGKGNQWDNPVRKHIKCPNDARMPIGMCEMTICFPHVHSGAKSPWANFVVRGTIPWIGRKEGARKLCHHWSKGYPVQQALSAEVPVKIAKYIRCQQAPDGGLGKRCEVTK